MKDGQPLITFGNMDGSVQPGDARAAHGEPDRSGMNVQMTTDGAVSSASSPSPLQRLTVQHFDCAPPGPRTGGPIDFSVSTRSITLAGTRSLSGRLPSARSQESFACPARSTPCLFGRTQLSSVIAVNVGWKREGTLFIDPGGEIHQVNGEWLAQSHVTFSAGPHRVLNLR
jgi:hypothetical protein